MIIGSMDWRDFLGYLLRKKIKERVQYGENDEK